MFAQRSFIQAATIINTTKVVNKQQPLWQCQQFFNDGKWRSNWPDKVEHQVTTGKRMTTDGHASQCPVLSDDHSLPTCDHWGYLTVI